MTSYKIRAKSLVAGSLLGAGSLLAACGGSPAAAPPTTTAVPTTTTTTTSVSYDCVGVGNSVGAVITPNPQTTSVAITLPISAIAGGSIAVGVNVGNLLLSAAPNFINLNASGVIASIAVAGANAPASVAADNFVGNGASLDMNLASTTRTATAGANTVTVGVLTIVSGASGFVCTPVGTSASATLNV